MTPYTLSFSFHVSCVSVCFISFCLWDNVQGMLLCRACLCICMMVCIYLFFLYALLGPGFAVFCEFCIPFNPHSNSFKSHGKANFLILRPFLCKTKKKKTKKNKKQQKKKPQSKAFWRRGFAVFKSICCHLFVCVWGVCCQFAFQSNHNTKWKKMKC